MASKQVRLGFGSARKVAEFFDVSERLVRDRAASGAWPSYCVGGRRVFDLDELVALVKSVRGRKDRSALGDESDHET